MKAIVVDDYGAEPELRDIPAPEPGPGEILVKVSSSSLNGFDRASTGGWLKGMIEHEFPFTVGKDFAGTVEAMGEGVTQYAVGDPVFGVVLGPVLHDGAFCEYLTVAENGSVAPIPVGLDPVAAGALGLAASTAVAVVDAAAAEQGETVLIVGATGGVGPLALQMLRDRGVQVIATARPGRGSTLWKRPAPTTPSTTAPTSPHRCAPCGPTGSTPPSTWPVTPARPPTWCAGMAGSCRSWAASTRWRIVRSRQLARSPHPIVRCSPDWPRPWCPAS